MNEELTNYMKSTKSTPKGKNMPNTMRTIIWITQSENTVKKLTISSNIIILNVVLKFLFEFQN